MGPNASRRSVLLAGLVVTGTFSGLVRPSEAWAASVAVDEPPIIGCAEWGARQSNGPVTVLNQRPVRIIVHHTATPNVQDLGRGAADLVARTIQNFHMDRRAWIDTGQNFTISRGGFVLEGRHRSLEVLRMGRRHVEGAHCTGQNAEAVGIENEGTYTTTAPPDALWERLRDMCAYICQQYDIAPTEIGGHRDFKDTICPGDTFYDRLPELRREVAGALGEGLSDEESRRASWPLLRPDDEGPLVQAAQHLLRSVGLTDVRPEARYDAATEAAVREFQRTHGTEFLNGYIGGETWPLLVSARDANRDEVALAVRAVRPSGAVHTASVPGAEEWKRLLSAAARA